LAACGWRSVTGQRAAHQSRHTATPPTANRQYRFMKIQSFEELDVYKISFDLQQTVFGLSKKFPKEESYSLTDQIRRSSRSVGANIAEAWRKRRYPAHFASKLTDSDGENSETQHWLRTACACSYIDQTTFDVLMDQSAQIGAKLGRMIADADKWQPR
jgi:four helix bundle protein